jgi:hypothetical protein
MKTLKFKFSTIILTIYSRPNSTRSASVALWLLFAAAALWVIDLRSNWTSSFEWLVMNG